MIFKLNRILILDSFENLPYFIIEEIRESHGLDNNINDLNVNYKIDINISSNILKTIYPDIDNETLKYEIETKIKFKKKTMNDLARFINPNSLWSVKSLVKAFEFLLLFTINDQDKILTFLPENLTFGQQTINNINSLNYCICYKICKLFGIHIGIETTKIQIENAIRYLRYDNYQLKKILQNFNKIDMINAIVYSKQDIKLNNQIYNNEKPNSKLLEESYKNLTDIKSLQNMFTPQNDKDAISMAAILYGINIINVKSPMDEFENIKNSSNYKPKDIWMLKWFLEDPNQFYIHIQFSPAFPTCFYKKNDLEKYLTNEGYINNFHNKKLSELYLLCNECYNNDNFFEFKQYNMLTDETIDLYNVYDIDKSLILCWGSKKTSTIPLQIDEIYNYFKSYNKCVKPTDIKSKLPDYSIRKLKSICIKNINIESYKKLYDLIIYYENLEETTDKEILNFLYKHKNKITHSLVIQCLFLILETGMYMRGWNKDKSFYPLKKEECEFDSEYETDVEINIIDSIAKYKLFKEHNPEITDDVESLPLFLYYKGTFERSYDKDKGTTILERLKMIEGGFEFESIKSCTKLSSNYLLSSTYKYIILLDEIPPFEISNMYLLLT